MKRGLRVKTGVVVPLRVVQDMHVTAERPVGFVVGGFEFTPAPLVPNIRCTATPPCGFCWYCREHAKVNA